MEIKSFKDIWNLPRGLKEVKRTFQNFDQDEDPEKVLEEILACAKRNPVLDDLLKVSKTYGMISRAEKAAEKGGWNYACQEAIKEMGVNYEVRGAENIPKNGGALYVSNHPYGLLDSTLLLGGLGSLVSKEKRKLKIIVMNQLRFIKGLEKVAYFVHSTVKGPNIGSLKESLRYLNKGGDLAIYPSGRMSKAGLREYPWTNGLGTFVLHSKYVVPMWFSGPNHAKIYNFLAFFKITEKMRRAFSLREVWDNTGKTVVLNIGKPISSEELISPEELKEKEKNKVMVQSLRQKAEALKVAV